MRARRWGDRAEELRDLSDPHVHNRRVPAQTGAAGLLSAVEAAGLDVVGPPRYVRFDPPGTPWFQRRNEVVVPVAA